MLLDRSDWSVLTLQDEFRPSSHTFEVSEGRGNV